MTPEERAALRALAEAATPHVWEVGVPGDDVTETVAEWVARCSKDPAAPAANRLHVVWVPDDEREGVIVTAITGDGPTSSANAEWIAAAQPLSVLSLLDALDAAEAERDRLAAAVERVRALHYAADNDASHTPACETCHGKAGVHECGCWADEDRVPVCGHCREGHKFVAVPWPCPTLRALDGGER